MSAQWREFRLALGSFTRLGHGALRPGIGSADAVSALRFLPLVGVLVGVIAALTYLLTSLLWPSSIAVVLSMLATVWLTEGRHELGLARLGDVRTPDTKPALTGLSFGVPVMLLFLLLKFDALMALSAAKLPFQLPANAGLGIIMIAGHAASRALLVSVLATQPGATARADPPRLSAGALSFALLTGFLPATILGLPGLIGLATAIVIRLAATHRAVPSEATQQLTELGFYLGALGAWSYI
jgi:adenosylcobinamide-GDP ribazoletransferase